MTKVTYVSFADTAIDAVPGHLWKYMPNVQTADLGRAKIKDILTDSFEVIFVTYLQSMLLKNTSFYRICKI